jgi:hypothetical protein
MHLISSAMYEQTKRGWKKQITRTRNCSEKKKNNNKKNKIKKIKKINVIFLVKIKK